MLNKCIATPEGTWSVEASTLGDKTLVYLCGTASLRRTCRMPTSIGIDQVQLEPMPVLENVTLAELLDPQRITRWGQKPRIWWQNCYEVPEDAKRQNFDILLPDGTLLRPQWGSNGATLNKLALFDRFVVARRVYP